MCYRCTSTSHYWDSATSGFLEIKQINNYEMKHHAMFGGTPLPVCAGKKDMQSSHVGLGFPNTEWNATDNTGTVELRLKCHSRPREDRINKTAITAG